MMPWETKQCVGIFSLSSGIRLKNIGSMETPLNLISNLAPLILRIGIGIIRLRPFPPSQDPSFSVDIWTAGRLLLQLE